MNRIADPRVNLESAGDALVAALNAPGMEQYLRSEQGQRWLSEISHQIRESDPAWLDATDEGARAWEEQHGRSTAAEAWEE